MTYSTTQPPGAVLGTARDGEQTLLKTLVAEQPGLFAGRVVLFDRNFPGHDLILAILLVLGRLARNSCAPKPSGWSTSCATSPRPTR